MDGKLMSGGADQFCDLRTQFIPFAEGGRRFWVAVNFGRDAPRQRIEQAYGVLDSLRIS